MIRLIASDMDGTLLQDGGHSINPEYHPVIQSLLKQGIFFVGASGRQFHSIAELFPNERKLCISSPTAAGLCAATPRC